MSLYLSSSLLIPPTNSSSIATSVPPLEASILVSLTFLIFVLRELVTVFATSSPYLSLITLNLFAGVVLFCGSLRSLPFLFEIETI